MFLDVHTHAFHPKIASKVITKLEDHYGIEPVGNAAGAGARLAALSDEAFAFSRSLAAGIEHVELASDRSFQNRFIAGLAFDPHH